MNSREKGKRGELELAAMLTERTGREWIRAAQRCGRNGQADVVPLHGFDQGERIVHCEGKRPARIAVREYLEQAKRDAASALPVVWMREDRNTEWMALLRAEDLIKLLGWEKP